MIEAIKLAVYAVAAAHVAHEATHYLIALVLGRNPSASIMGLREDGTLKHIGMIEVYHEAGERLTRGDWAIHAGPIVVGAVAATVWMLAGNPIELYHVVGWFVYTLLGAPNDLKFVEAEPTGP